MDVLNKPQKDFLELFKQNNFLVKKFYLTGGTALAAFYLYHRYSEDIDFFSEEEVDLLPIDAFLKNIKNRLGISAIDSQQSYNRNLFFLHLKNQVLKVEFTYFPFSRIERGIKEGGIEIESLLDIAVNKLFSIYQRTHARDYIDLYFICRERGFAISDLIKKAKVKFDWHIDPLQLGTQFVKAGEAKDYPKMIKDINHADWQKFFLSEARKLKGEIIE